MFLRFIVAFAISAAASAKADYIYVDQAFTGNSAPGWVFVTGQGDGPKLTAAEGIDSDGSGWLRLTKDATNQSSFVYYDTPIPTNRGLTFQFDFVTWSATSSVGDGFALALFDANVTPAAGGYGGSLGYAQRSGIDGLAGGIVGFGFDEFGNFSNPTEGRVGGPGRVRNAVAIRGSMGADRRQGYEYVTGTGSLANFSAGSKDTRPEEFIHSVRITISTAKVVTVEWKLIDSVWETLIDAYPCTLTCPEEIKFGFTGGTGAVYANHEIRNLEVSDAQAVPEPGSLALAVGLGLVAAVGWWRKRAGGADA